MTPLLRLLFSRRMAVLLGLGFASGLPLGLTGATLQAWMTDAGVDLTTIGVFSLVTLPYTLKFAWSPAMDLSVALPLGRRRGWLLLTQIALVVAIAAMAMVGTGSLQLLAATALMVAFFSASQDIVADAYRTDLLIEAERGFGAAVFVTGYRVAMLVATGASLVVVDRYDVPWRAMFLILAGCMGVGMIVTLFAPEPRGAAPPRTLAQAVIQPFAEFMKRRGWLLVLVFIVVFRLPDVMAGAMRMPFLQRGVGFTKEQIGTIANSYGMFMTIVGALFGGGVVARLGLWRSLWVFAALQALSNFGFYMLTLSGPDRAALTVVISVENFCGGLVTAGFVAFLMSQCDRRFSATQYALLSSLMAVTGVIAGTPTGALVERAGWQTFFLVSIVMAIPGLALLPFVKPSTIDAPGTAPASRERDGFEVVASK